MIARVNQRIMMISTHGYVAAEPCLGKVDTGGQVAYVLELSKSLSRLGYRVDILTRQFEKQPFEEHVNGRVRLLRFPCGGPDFIPKETLCDHISEWVERVAQFVGDLPSPYVCLNSHYWDAGLAGRMLAARLRIPHIHTPHSLGSWKRDNMDGDRRDLERAYNFCRRIQEERRVYRTCDLTVATTRQQRDILAAREYRVPSDRIRVLPPGYDESRFSAVSAPDRQLLKQKLALEGRVVLGLGRLARNKGFDLLVRAMPTVLARIEDARLYLLVGSSDLVQDERAQLDALRSLACELGVAERVVIRDRAPDGELADYYRAADVFAMSSRYEPFGMTAIEAMACGTPVVVSTQGGLWEDLTWGVDAMYADPRDPEAFGHALCPVLSSPRIAQQLSRHGREKALSSYAWSGIARRMASLVEELPRPTAPPRPRMSAAIAEW